MTGICLTVDLSAAEPPYEQVRRQIAGYIATGALREGDRLPAIRALAGELGLAANTVARAFKELEAAGLIRTRRRTGTVVLAPGGNTVDATLRRSAGGYAAAARQAGLSETEAVDLFRAAFREATT
jgi:DNA-binding transcriptional regulator YhcF (GntR family)